MRHFYGFVFFLFISASLSADEINGVNKEKAAFRNLINGSKTVFVRFTKSQKLKGSEKAFVEEGKIYYRKSPMLFKLEMPSETILIKEKTIERFLPKFNEKYVNDWDGRNPFFLYLDIPDGVIEVKKSSSNIVDIQVIRDNGTVKICYDKTKKNIKSIREENPVCLWQTEVEAFETDVVFEKGVFDLPGDVKVVDLRK
ncbi:MAG: hypothetical protein ABIJ15_00590 [bacterium]